MVLQDRGLRSTQGKNDWIDCISGRKVDVEDFDEVMDLLQLL